MAETELQKIGKVLWTYRWRFGIMLTILVLLPFGVSSFLQWFTGERSWRILDPNEIGDSFGFLNSIMSSIAAIGVVIAIYLQQKQLIDQREQLDLQRQELALQRQEMKDSREELRKSAEAQAKMVEMQFFHSYLSGVTQLATYDEDGSDEHLGEFKNELTTLIERMKAPAYSFVSNQKFYSHVVYEKITKASGNILTYLRRKEYQKAKNVALNLMTSMEIWNPALAASKLHYDQEMYKLTNEFLIEFIVSIPVPEISNKIINHEEVMKAFHKFSGPLDDILVMILDPDPENAS